MERVETRDTQGNTSLHYRLYQTELPEDSAVVDSGGVVEEDLICGPL